MDRPSDRLNNFIARSGAGMDAAGRTVYSGPGMLYAGPGEFARTQQVHNQLMADESKDDPETAMIRQLLDQLKMRNLPGRASIPVYPVATGNVSYSHQEGR
jgi:hypothetical protein